MAQTAQRPRTEMMQRGIAPRHLLGERWIAPRRPHVVLLTTVLALGWHIEVRAACNIIPPAAQVFPSTLGSVTSPITTAGNEVALRLSTVCDGSTASFDASDVVAIRFLPADPGQPPPISVGTFTVEDCVGGQCGTLRFTMPDTSALAPPYGFAGPAEIVVTQGGTEVAHIGPLFQPHEIGSTCDKQPETVFQNFTVLPPPNVFKTILDALLADPPQQTHALATLDGSGSLLVPVDWLAELPLGSGAPVARLVNATLNVDAFPATSGRIHVAADDVHSFTIDGKPLPPLIRVTDSGDTVLGTSDSVFSVIRIARVNSQDEPNFDLSYLPNVSTHGPIVFGNADFSLEAQTSVPLVDLKASPTGAAFATDEGTEGSDLNGDDDETDQVVHVVDVGTGATTNTQMAASPLKSPIVGTAAIATDGNLAAFIESEAHENQDPMHPEGADLDGNGQRTDDILRVFTLHGVDLTPGATRLASLFPAIDRNPIAVDGSFVYYRVADVRLGFPADGVAAQHLAVTSDGRYFVSTDAAGGTLGLQRRDGASGLPRGASVSFNQPGVTDGAGAIATFGQFAFAATLPKSVIGVEMNFFDVDSALHIPDPATTPAIVTNDWLQGVTRLGLTPPGTDSPPGQSVQRVSLYALAPGVGALTAFDVSPRFSFLFGHAPRLSYSQTLKDPSGGCAPDATTVCIGPMADARSLVVSPDGNHVYVAAYGSNVIKRFVRTLGSPNLTELSDTSITQPLDLVVSPDGAYVYAMSPQVPLSCLLLGQPCFTLVTYHRDAVTGALAFAQSGAISADAVKLVMSPDGKALYVMQNNGTTGDNGFTTFARNTATGALASVQSFVGIGVPHVAGLLDAVVSPDSEHLYTQHNPVGGVTGGRFSRSGALQVFDAATQMNRVSVNTSTNLAVVAAGRAAFMAPGGLFTSAVELYDGATDTTATVEPGITGTGPEKNKLALSAQGVVYTRLVGLPAVPKLAVASTSPPYATQQIDATVIDLGATDVCGGGAKDGEVCTTTADCPDGACGAVAVFTSASAPGNVLKLYRALDASTETVALDGSDLHDVIDFQLSGNILAFRAAEAGTIDLNDDGDMEDIVMFAYHFKSRRTFSTVMASQSCQVVGCEPGLPYKIRDGAVYFTTDEQDQGCPLPSTDCLPTLSGGGRDLNRDGHLGVVLQIFGDSDGDGVFDPYDDCRETVNSHQLDTDGDGLGDGCDPLPTCAPLTPAAPPVPPAGALACQKAIGNASRKLLKTRMTAERKCLDLVAAGKLVGDPSALCRGLAPVFSPTDETTGTKIAKAIAKFQTVAGAKCSDISLGQLAACGTTASALTACVSARTAVVASELTTLLYGQVTAIGDPAALACQKGVGKVGATELASVAKAIGGCLDHVNAGLLNGNSQTTCLGAWAVAGPVAPADLKTGESIDKAAAKATRTIQTKCSPGTLAALGACGGGSAAGVADCIRCAVFGQAAGLVEDTY